MSEIGSTFWRNWTVRPIVGMVIQMRKFVLGRSLSNAEQILGLRSGELMAGAALLRSNRLPGTSDFDLAGYTNVAAYPGYPSGLGPNRWVLTVDVSATVLKTTGQGGTF